MAKVFQIVSLLLILPFTLSCTDCKETSLILPNGEVISNCETIKDISEKYKVTYQPIIGFLGKYEDKVLKDIIFIPNEDKNEEDPMAPLFDEQIEELKNQKIGKIVFQKISNKQMSYEAIVRTLTDRYGKIIEVKFIEPSLNGSEDKMSKIVNAKTNEVLSEIEFISALNSTIVTLLPIKYNP